MRSAEWKTAFGLTTSAQRFHSALRIPNSALPSLPLDRARRFGRNVETDAVNAFHFVDDPARDPGQDVIRHPHPIGGHPVLPLDDPERYGIIVGALVAHHADGTHRQEESEGLPDAIIPVA